MIYYEIEKQDTTHGFIWIPKKKEVLDDEVSNLIHKNDIIIFTHKNGRYDHHNNLYKDVVINGWEDFDKAKSVCISKIQQENIDRLNLVTNYQEQ